MNTDSSSLDQPSIKAPGRPKAWSRLILPASVAFLSCALSIGIPARLAAQDVDTSETATSETATPKAAGQETTTATEEASESLSVETQILGKGRYRLEGEGFVTTPAQDALRVLVAFDEHCAEGCRWPISSIDHLEIVETSSEGEIATEAGDETTLFTWAFIDDVLDATYFQRARFRFGNGAALLHLETPSPEEIQVLKDERRDHKPFFHEQKVTWRAEPAVNELTRIHVVMEMASDSFMINLMPSRVLDGAEKTLQEYFSHVAAAAGAGTDHRPTGQ